LLLPVLPLVPLLGALTLGALVAGALALEVPALVADPLLDAAGAGTAPMSGI
jgi:hypothetical protein